MNEKSIVFKNFEDRIYHFKLSEIILVIKETDEFVSGVFATAHFKYTQIVMRLSSNDYNELIASLASFEGIPEEIAKLEKMLNA